jgi:hypothetical protein
MRIAREFLAIQTFSGTDVDTSSDKYAFLKHDIGV